MLRRYQLLGANTVGISTAGLTLAAGLLFITSLVANADDTDNALGIAEGLSGESNNSATVLPKGASPSIPNGVRPVIVLPPESLEPHTLVVPLPGETAPPVVIKRNAIQAVPSLQPALPKNKTPEQANAEKNSKATSKKKPLDPIVY